MPVTNITEGRDTIYGVLQTAMAASAYASVPIFYPDTVKDAPNGQDAYLRAFADHTTERQVSLGEVGNRRFRVYGIVTVQIFTPYGQGQAAADQISGVVKDAFRGVSTGSDKITFRNTRVVDVGRDGSYLQTNVLSEFDYDEIA